MHTRRIAFVVAIPDSATSFLNDHFAYFQRYYQVHLLANFKGRSDLREEFEQMGIVCHDAPIERKINVFKDLQALFAVTHILLDGNFDCVHSVTPKAGFITALAAWFARVPNRLHIFTGQVWATRKGLMRLMLKMMDKIIVALDTFVMVDGPGQRDFLIREGVVSAKNSMVPAEGSIAGVNLDRFVISEPVRQAERAKLGYSPEDVVFIYLGRITHDKGIGELFEAFNSLAAECPKCKLLIYGRDEEAYDKRANQYPNIKRGVNYLYQGPTKTPYNALQAGDVFVLPTWREGFGVSVLEAQALGLPVITSDAYGVVDASVEGETGLRCHVNDPEGLYKCMKAYYDNPEMRRRHGANGRKRVEDHFNNEVVSRAWVEIYRGILGN